MASNPSLTERGGGGREPQTINSVNGAALEPDMREVVEKFEELFAELAPPPEEDRQVTPDDLFRDLTLGDSRPGAGIAQPRAPAARSGLDHPAKPAAAEAPAADTGRAARLPIDEAVALLRAAEARGKAASERAAREARDDGESEMPRVPLAGAGALPVVAQRRDIELAKVPRAPVRPAVPDEWSAKSATFWMILLIVSSVALAVGTGVGYLMGRDQSAPAASKIQTSPEGGARLRADHELRKR